MGIKKKTPTAAWIQRAHITKQRRVKNPPIKYELWQLHNISQDAMLFLNLIIRNRWLDCVYTGEMEHDKKLQFIHAWYNARNSPKEPEKSKEEPPDNQMNLFD